MHALLGASGRAWRHFASGWNAMPVDTYMADGGAYRRRRYGVFEIGSRSIAAAGAQPHYQSRVHNRLNGGVERWFAGLAAEVAESMILRRILECCRETYAPLVPTVRRWRAEVHQFRIEAGPCSAGHPAPEGRHRDGVIAGFVLLVARAGVAGGVTRLWSLEGGALASFTMTANCSTTCRRCMQQQMESRATVMSSSSPSPRCRDYGGLGIGCQRPFVDIYFL